MMPGKPEDTASPRPLLGIVISLIAYFFFVIASSLVREFSARFPTVQILFIQSCISLICILPIALRKGVRRLKSSFLADHFIRDLFGLSSYFLFFLAIRDLTLVDAVTLNYTAPFFVPLIWWIWTKQKVGIHVWWSILIGFIGVATILNPTREIFQLGFIYGLFAGIASAVAFCALRVLNLHREPMSRTLFYFFSFSVLLTFPFTLVTWVPPSIIEWGKMGVIGASTAIAQILLTVAYRYGTASYLSPLGYVTVIYAGLISWFIFDTAPTWRSWVGTVLIILGGTVTCILKKRPKNIAQAFETPDPKEKPPL